MRRSAITLAVVAAAMIAPLVASSSLLQREEGEHFLLPLDVVGAPKLEHIIVQSGDWIRLSSSRGEIDDMNIEGTGIEKVATLTIGARDSAKGVVGPPQGHEAQGNGVGWTRVLIRAVKDGKAVLRATATHGPGWKETRQFEVDVQPSAM
jgi:hypothetical protein